MTFYYNDDYELKEVIIAIMMGISLLVSFVSLIICVAREQPFGYVIFLFIASLSAFLLGNVENILERSDTHFYRKRCEEAAKPQGITNWKKHMENILKNR